MVNISDLDKYYVTYNDVEFTDFYVDINSNSSYNFSFLDLENSWKNGESLKPLSRLYITFSGPKFVLYGSKGFNFGKFRFRVTGFANYLFQANQLEIDWQTIDCYSPNEISDTILYENYNLNLRDYVLELEVLEDKNVKSSGNRIKVNKYMFTYNVYAQIGNEEISDKPAFKKDGWLV
jgi:hypothetical protein